MSHAGVTVFLRAHMCMSVGIVCSDIQYFCVFGDRLQLRSLNVGISGPFFSEGFAAHYKISSFSQMSAFKTTYMVNES